MPTSLLAVDAVPCSEAKPGPSRFRLRFWLIGKCIALAVLVMFIAEVLRIFVGSNFFSVVEGKCYRSAQPTTDFLQDVKRQYGVRTILNLRDENEDESWYQQEKLACRRLGMILVNAGLSSKEQPPEVDFWRFVHAVKTAQEPILIHCANGNDRTGLASAVYLMLRTPTSIAEARGHLSLRYGHFAWGKASCLHRILDSYEAWLLQNGFDHNADHFCHWAQFIYRQE